VRKWALRFRLIFYVLKYHTSKSVFTVQRAFHSKYAKDPHTDKTIRAWFKQDGGDSGGRDRERSKLGGQHNGTK